MYRIKELAELLQGKIEGNESLEISKLSPFFDAEEEDITFAGDENFLSKLDKTKANVIIVPDIDLPNTGKTYIKVNKNPRQLMPVLLNFFKPKIKKISKLIEDSAVISKSAEISQLTYIGHDVHIGDNTVIYPNVNILEGTKIGKNCVVYPNVTIREFTIIGDNVIIQPGAVIGSDGFGYVKDSEGNNIKIDQIGRVILENNVEIGANTTIDRGAIGDTIVKEYTKIDNLVQIAHNDKIGRNCIIISQAGIAGSTEVGDNTTIAGQVGVSGHLKIGNNVTITAKSGVTNDVKDNTVMSGFPLRPHQEEMKIKISQTKLPDIIKKIRKLEKEIEELKK